MTTLSLHDLNQDHVDSFTCLQSANKQLVHLKRRGWAKKLSVKVLDVIVSYGWEMVKKMLDIVRVSLTGCAKPSDIDMLKMVASHIGMNAVKQIEGSNSFNNGNLFKAAFAASRKYLDAAFGGKPLDETTFEAARATLRHNIKALLNTKEFLDSDVAFMEYCNIQPPSEATGSVRTALFKAVADAFATKHPQNAAAVQDKLLELLEAEAPEHTAAIVPKPRRKLPRPPPHLRLTDDEPIPKELGPFQNNLPVPRATTDSHRNLALVNVSHTSDMANGTQQCMDSPRVNLIDIDVESFQLGIDWARSNTPKPTTTDEFESPTAKELLKDIKADLAKEARLSKVRARKVGQKVDGVADQVDGVGKKIERVDKKVDRVGKKVDAVSIAQREAMEDLATLARSQDTVLSRVSRSGLQSGWLQQTRSRSPRRASATRRSTFDAATTSRPSEPLWHPLWPANMPAHAPLSKLSRVLASGQPERPLASERQANEMMDGGRVRAGLDCSAPHLYCASSFEPMRCSQVLCCVVCWSVYLEKVLNAS